MNFKTYRTKSGMTQEEVALAIGIPKKTYQNYEYEVREADSDILCALADLYGITLDELVGREETAPHIQSKDEKLEEISRLYGAMNDVGREALMAVAEVFAEKFRKE